MKALSVIVVIPFLLSASDAFSDESDCVSFFQQDIHNKLVILDNSTGKQLSSSSLCKSQASASSAGLSVQYAGVGVGFSDASSLAQAMCDNKYSQSDFANGHNVYQSVVDPNIMQAVTECFKLNAKGLHYNVHSNSDTHSITIAMTYDGPKPITIKDIVLDGNVKCEGQLYSAWTAGSGKPLNLDAGAQGLTCVPKDTAAVSSSPAPASTSDIEAGTITVVTDAGPIYAQIPRRFAPSLEGEFRQLQSIVTAMGTDLAEDKSLLKKHILASGFLRGGKVISISDGATIDQPSGRLTFPNPAGLKFTPMPIAISPNGAYLTGSCFVKSIGPDFVVFAQGALDTGGRVFPLSDCAFAVVSNGA